MALFYGSWYPSQFFKTWSSPSYNDLGPLAKHYKYIHTEAHRMARTMFYYMARYQQGLEKRQMILGRLMEIGTDLFAMSAVCSYAAKLNKENPEDKTPFELADYFCNLARLRNDQRFENLTNNTDKQANEVAKDVLNDEFRWLEKGVMPIPPVD
jgi:hypothetical protein